MEWKGAHGVAKSGREICFISITKSVSSRSHKSVFAKEENPLKKAGPLPQGKKPGFSETFAWFYLGYASIRAHLGNFTQGFSRFVEAAFVSENRVG